MRFQYLATCPKNRWLKDLRRVCAKDAVLLLTTHGETALQTIVGSKVHQEMLQMTSQSAAEILEGFPNRPYVHLTYQEETRNMAKAGDSYGNCFISRAYIEQHWPKFGFELLEYIPGGMRGFQDIVLLRKTS